MTPWGDREPAPYYGAIIGPPLPEPFSRPLFGPGEQPRPEDVIQGEINNCGLAGVMVALAHAKPGDIQEMIVARRFPVWTQVGRTTSDLVEYTVHFRSPNRRFPNASVRVTNRLYHRGPDLIFAHSPTPILWVAILEKAYAVFWGGVGLAGGYEALQNGQPGARQGQTGPPTADELMNDVVGRHDRIDLPQLRLSRDGSLLGPLTAERFKDYLVRADRFPTISVTPDVPGGVVGRTLNGLWINHTYAVLGMNRARTRVRLRDPLGDDLAPGDANIPLSFEDFQRDFRAAFAARPPE